MARLAPAMMLAVLPGLPAAGVPGVAVAFLPDQNLTERRQP